MTKRSEINHLKKEKFILAHTIKRISANHGVCVWGGEAPLRVHGKSMVESLLHGETDSRERMAQNQRLKTTLKGLLLLAYLRQPHSYSTASPK